ncbi:MAG TPA: transcriptional regulator, partial [Xanthobacteraceae bacterium]
RSPLHDPKLPLSAASIMMSFRTMYARKRAKGEAATIGFRFGDEAFVVALGPDGVRVRRDEPEGCALVIRTSPKSLASVVYAGRPLADAEAAGDLTFTGKRALLERFVGWFPLPEKIA